MRQRILLGGQLAVLSVVILTIVWYRDFLQETFKPIRELFPVPGKSDDIRDRQTQTDHI